MILLVCIYYMMCNVSYVVCRYSILNGVIDSREVRRAKATGPSRSSGAASRQRSRQGAIKDVRFQEVIAQCDDYYQN
jgi:Ni,Fe-hydrogenase III large subunit